MYRISICLVEKNSALLISLVVEFPNGVDEGLLVPTNTVISVVQNDAGFPLLPPRINGQYGFQICFCSIDFFLNPLAVARVHSAWNNDYMGARYLIEDCFLKRLGAAYIVNGVALRDREVSKIQGCLAGRPWLAKNPL